MKWLKMKVPPPIITIIVAVIMWNFRHHDGVNIVLFSSSGLQKLLLFLLIITGFAIEILALIKLRQYKTTINPINPHSTSTLVKTGVYAFTRNPMYLGMQLQLMAFSFYLNGLLPFVICFAYGIYIQLFQVEPEEKILQKQFDEIYQAYQSKVPRWIGKIR